MGAMGDAGDPAVYSGAGSGIALIRALRDYATPNGQVYDGSAAWANNAPPGTAVTIDIPFPAGFYHSPEALYQVVVTDPSADSDLTVTCSNLHTFGGVARYPVVRGTPFTVLRNNANGNAALVQGWFLGEAARITLSNDQLVGAAGAFTAYVHVRRLA